MHEELPLSWSKALLAVIPGLVATAGFVRTDFSVWMMVGLILLFSFLVFVYWWNTHLLPGWSLMTVGMLTAIGLTVVSGVIGGLAAIIAGKSASTFVLLTLIATLITLLGLYMRTQSVPWFAWALSALIILCQLAVRSKYFFLFGVSWSVAGQALNISLYSAVIALLLPVTVGLFLAKRYGQLTMLFVIGMIYVSFQILIDVNFKVSTQIGYTKEFIAYKALIPFLITVAAPLWFLRARSSFSRLGGLLTLVGLAVIMNLLVVGMSYAGKLALIVWISFIPYTISVLLTMAMAYMLFREREKRSTQALGASA